MYNHMVGRAASVVSPFYFVLLLIILLFNNLSSGRTKFIHYCKNLEDVWFDPKDDVVFTNYIYRKNLEGVGWELDRLSDLTPKRMFSLQTIFTGSRMRQDKDIHPPSVYSHYNIYSWPTIQQNKDKCIAEKLNVRWLVNISILGFCAHLLFQLWIFSFWIHCKIKKSKNSLRIL